MEIDAENLISLVFTKKALWDKSSKQYRNRLIVEKLWRQVSTELGGYATTDAIKKKWKNLRNTFGKELRKIPEERSGAEAPSNFETYTTWPHFDSMLFLRDQMKIRKSGGNLPTGGSENEDDSENVDPQQSVAGTISDKPDEADNPDEFEIESVAEVFPHTSSHPPNRTVKRGVQQQLIDIETRKLRILEKKVNKSSAGDDDEDLSFFKSLLPHVRKLKPEDKLEFRMEVQSVVQNYVYKKNRLRNEPNSEMMQNPPWLASHNEVAIRPLPNSHESPPPTGQDEIDSVEYLDDPIGIEEQNTTMISTETQHYSVITSPITNLSKQV